MSLRTALRINLVHRYVGQLAYVARMLFTRPTAAMAIDRRAPSDARHATPPDDGLPRAYDRDGALRFPFSPGAYDTGVRYLFDFAVLANSLGHRPGAVILDFASGPGYVSELLNRFGFTTIAIDADRTMLGLARERLGLDPRCDVRRSAFAAGDGMQLPFRAASIDGIVCMNALHHMPDYRTVLAEMFRVLKPAGRALFSEPGSEHSLSPQSISAMREFGALERDVVLSEIHRHAREIGFARMVLKPFVYPDTVDLPCDELERFRIGKRVSTRNAAPWEIADFIERCHPIFFLEKGGSQPATSATSKPELLRARISISSCPTRVAATDVVRIAAHCHNTGRSTWLAQPRPLGGHVALGVKILRADGRLIGGSGARTALPRDVPPGDAVELTAEVALAGLAPGSYRLVVDMVNELICWFEAVGSPVAQHDLEIVAAGV
jgi:SAM-dependent methyltransferase